jgi:hypothetical protein
MVKILTTLTIFYSVVKILTTEIKNATCFYSEHSSYRFNIECEPTIIVDV